MKTSADIEAALPELSTEDLHHIECTIHRLYRSRHDRVIYDAYGIWLENDQTSAAAEVLGILDKQEEHHAGSDAEIIPVPNDRPSPKFGSAKGRISMSDDFDEPIEDFDEHTR